MGGGQEGGGLRYNLPLPAGEGQLPHGFAPRRLDCSQAWGPPTARPLHPLSPRPDLPHLLLGARQGYRLGDAVLRDALFYDGLEDAHSHEAMGLDSEHYLPEFPAVTRERQDAFAAASTTLLTRVSPSMTKTCSSSTTSS